MSSQPDLVPFGDLSRTPREVMATIEAAIARVIAVIDENRVVSRQDRAAAIAEYGLHTLVRQDLDDDLGARHLLAGERMAGDRKCGGTVFHDCFRKLTGAAYLKPSRIVHLAPVERPVSLLGAGRRVPYAFRPFLMIAEQR